MILIQHDYRIIKIPKMTETFIIRPEKVQKVWDITEGKIGISFNSNYDKYIYAIELDDEDKKLLAKDVLKMILKNDKDYKIIGSVSIK